MDFLQIPLFGIFALIALLANVLVSAAGAYLALTVYHRRNGIRS